MTQFNFPNPLYKKPWEELTSMTQKFNSLKVRVSGVNQGGCLCLVKGLRGFIPSSQLDSTGNEKNKLVGKILEVIPIEVDPENNRLILSERKVTQQRYFNSLKEGNIIDGKISKIKLHGFLIDLGKEVKGFLSNSSFTSDIERQNLMTGETISVCVVNKDNNGKIDLAPGRNFSKKPMETPKETLKNLKPSSQQVPHLQSHQVSSKAGDQSRGILQTFPKEALQNLKSHSQWAPKSYQAFSNSPARDRVREVLHRFPKEISNKQFIEIDGYLFLNDKLSSGTKLSDIQFGILSYLLQNRGKTVTYESIIQELDNEYNIEININDIRQNIFKLRKEFGNKSNVHIKNERMKGYRLMIN